MRPLVLRGEPNFAGAHGASMESAIAGHKRE